MVWAQSLDIIRLILIVSLIYIALMIIFWWYRQKKRQDTIAMKKYTLELCMRDNFDYENILLSEKQPYYKQLESKQNKIIEGNILKVLSYFDKIAIGLANGMYDEEIIMQYYGKYFLTFLEYYKYSLKKYRNIKESPFIFIHFERYANKWLNSYPEIIKRRGGYK